MIELTDKERESVRDGKAVRIRENGQEYVLLRPDVYDRLVDQEIDMDRWTAEELDRLREESVSVLDHFGKQPRQFSAATATIR